MLYLKAKYLKTAELAPRGEFPASCLVSVLDDDSGETLHLISDREPFDQLQGLKQFADITLRLAWRREDLSKIGGRGKAYRLRVAGVVAR